MMCEQCHTEVVGLHDFFVAWFKGITGKSGKNFQRLSSVLATEFEIIKPDGNRLDRKGLIDDLWAFHGGYQDNTFDIEIKNYQNRSIQEGLYIVTYEEWTQIDENLDARLSTVIFKNREGTQNRVEWLHVHETWLPGFHMQEG
jgi:hypothetical protein